VIALLGAAARFAAALLLVYAACGKLAAPRSFRLTLTALRMPGPKVIGAVVPVVELGAAVALCIAPNAAVTALLVAGVGTTFAAAGLLALVRGERIRCACYGQSGDAQLGRPQLIAWPLWLAVAGSGLFLPASGPTGAPLVAATLLAVAVAVAAVRLRPLAQRNHSYLAVLESQAKYQAQEMT
jgi:hypothetical protein